MYTFSNLDLITSVYNHNRKFIKYGFQVNNKMIYDDEVCETKFPESYNTPFLKSKTTTKGILSKFISKIYFL